MALWRINCERRYIVELRLSPGIHACFELRMDASKVCSIRGSDHYNCTWTVAHDTLWFFACFVLIGVQIFPFNTKRASVSLRHWHTERKNSRASWLPKLSLVLPFAPLPSKWFGSLFNKLLFFSLMSRWLHLSVLKLHFEACFACSAQYFLGQSLRSFSAPLQGLSRLKRPNKVKTVCFTYPLHSILVSAG